MEECLKIFYSPTKEEILDHKDIKIHTSVLLKFRFSDKVEILTIYGNIDRKKLIYCVNHIKNLKKIIVIGDIKLSPEGGLIEQEIVCENLIINNSNYEFTNMTCNNIFLHNTSCRFDYLKLKYEDNFYYNNIDIVVDKELIFENFPERIIEILHYSNVKFINCSVDFKVESKKSG